MAQRSWDEILRSAVDGEVPVADVLRAMFDRSTGVAAVPEGTTLDFKVKLDPNDSASAGEIARDILAFSNTEGGLLVGGVHDTRRAVGHTSLDVRQFRQSLGPYLGTRVDYDYSEASIAVAGREVKIVALLVPRSKASTPALLRKLIQQGGLLRKVKYLPGSLFYRSGDQTVVEPPGEAADDRAQALGFRGPRPALGARSSSRKIGLSSGCTTALTIECSVATQSWLRCARCSMIRGVEASPLPA